MNAQEDIEYLREMIIEALYYDEQASAAIAAIAAALDEREALRKACKAVMRPDGHYVECPCTGEDSEWGRGHKHMPNNPTVAICQQLRAALGR